MRIFQFVSWMQCSAHFILIFVIHSQIFAVCALYTTVNFESEVKFNCKDGETLNIEYPFRFGQNVCPKAKVTGVTANSTKLYLSGDVSSDAQFFVATGVLSILYCIFIVAVYTVIDEIYKNKAEIPLAVSSLFAYNTYSEYWIQWILSIQNCDFLCSFYLGFYVDNNFGHFLVSRFGCMVKWCRCIENANRSNYIGQNLFRLSREYELIFASKYIIAVRLSEFLSVGFGSMVFVQRNNLVSRTSTWRWSQQRQHGRSKYLNSIYCCENLGRIQHCQPLMWIDLYTDEKQETSSKWEKVSLRW